MIACVDASVLLRVALRQPDALPEWRRIAQGVSSALIMPESLRTLDRLRLRARLPDAEVATRRAKILEMIASLEVVELDAAILDHAAQPMPTEHPQPLGAHFALMDSLPPPLAFVVLRLAAAGSRLRGLATRRRGRVP